MGAPVGLFLLTLLNIFTSLTSGVLVTSCVQCHAEAECSRSKERGDSFLAETLSCVCNDGFVGDGLTCYNAKLCSDSSCCKQGYHWSKEEGCVDIDECSQPDLPCTPPQICSNIPGSFECLQPSFNIRSRSVHPNCPSGMDFVHLNGTNQCVDPCVHYTELNEDWRSTNVSMGPIHCDQNRNWQGWYRFFLHNVSAHIPEYCVKSHSCGTHAPMWIQEPHPTQTGIIVTRTVCNTWSNTCCFFNTHNIQVKRCPSNYFVYKLAPPTACSLAYCAEVNGTNEGDSGINSTVLPPFETTQPIYSSATTPSANTSITEGEVRLVNGGNSSCSGRVEIFHNGQWGTVCDDLWDLNDAQVVCRQLGCGRVLSAPMHAHFGQGRGPIWLDNVMCTGSESKLSECRHQGVGSHNCGHNEDAGVVCEAAAPVRLVNSDGRCSGRVEILHNGQWGTVCDDSWGLNDAEVVCRQLDCGRALSAPTNAAFGQGSGPIWLDDVHCSGNELSITECSHLGFGIHNCNHHEDASVVCEVIHPQPDAFHLTCDSHRLQIGLQRNIMAQHGLNALTAHLADRNCTAVRFSGRYVWYEAQTQAESCGNMMRSNQTHVTYTNNIFIYPMMNTSLRTPMRLPFSCIYPLNGESSLDVAIRPVLIEEEAMSGWGGQAEAHMSLFRNSEFTDRYPPGLVTLPVGSMLYVGVTVDRDPGFAVVLEDCYASHDQYPNSYQQYPLIRNRCPVDNSQVSVIENGRSTQARFSALIFLLDGKNRNVFLHCSFSLCNRNQGPCVSPCRGRKRRSVSSSTILDSITIGPIKWAN